MGAVFLSYASQDAEAARRICNALRAAGIEVWFDQSELRGGDAWDRHIRERIHDCRLFIAVISANTEARDEGYFRREWNLAVDRTHDMSERRAFLVPVVIDGTSDQSASVPDKFHAVQWTRLPAGGASPAFVERVAGLLRQVSPAAAAFPAAPAPPAAGRTGVWRQIRRHKVMEWTLAYVAFGYALLHGVEIVGHAFELPAFVARLTIYLVSAGLPLAIAIAWYHGHRAQHRVSGPELTILIALLLISGSILWLFSGSWQVRQQPQGQAPGKQDALSARVTPPTGSAGPPPFNPPAHSIAVLPFVNMSGDKEQEYFSDGLTEEILNSLARINELQVSARTSAFYFKDAHADLSTIAHALNVASILEGSVRRSGHTIRITAQLNNAVTGFHLWSQTYDRDLGDVLKLQTEIARAVASALKVTLLGDVQEKIELGGTRNARALDAYLRGYRVEFSQHNAQDYSTAIGAYTEAIRVDPGYVLAIAARAMATSEYARIYASGPDRSASFDKALRDAHAAVALAPDLAEAHLALAFIAHDQLDFAGAEREYQQALRLAPGNVRALRSYGLLAGETGRTDLGLSLIHRALVLDPLNMNAYGQLAGLLADQGRYRESLAAYQQAQAIDARMFGLAMGMAWDYYKLGDLPSAQVWCERITDFDRKVCLGLMYSKLGRKTDAAAVLSEAQREGGDTQPYFFAEIYAELGDKATSLEWLERAYRLHDPNLMELKADDALIPLRQEPRYLAIERAMKLAN